MMELLVVDFGSDQQYFEVYIVFLIYAIYLLPDYINYEQVGEYCGFDDCLCGYPANCEGKFA